MDDMDRGIPVEAPDKDKPRHDEAKDQGRHDDLYLKVHPDYFSTQRKDLFWYERLWGVLLAQLEKRVGGRMLIEFGSGPGFMLKLAQRRGWDAYGEEPSAVARAHTKRIGATSAEPGFWVWQSDAGIATEVLEHVEDPLATLIQWRDAIVQGGFLALSVPNDGNPLQRLFGKRISPDGKTPRWWIHPTHKSHFNHRSLRELLEMASFKVVWQRTSFPVELLLVIPGIPRKWAWKLSRVWPAPPLLWRWGVGRHCLVIAKKT